MRILGLDMGTRRIGVALSDALGLTAQPLTVLVRTTSSEDLAAVEAMVAHHHVDAVVVGLPLTLRGQRGPQAQQVMAFAETLRRRLSVPIHLVDERLTTVQGTRALIEMGTRRRVRRQTIDRVAAQLILQQFLESQRR
ncbi:MAG: Holliday junction resolvase RuvX [Candidatus Omnitrophota bacterium]|nr:Holliday junction resolvase RuvX [Candidatus Omnitrophota bacterium]